MLESVTLWGSGRELTHHAARASEKSFNTSQASPSNPAALERAFNILVRPELRVCYDAFLDDPASPASYRFSRSRNSSTSEHHYEGSCSTTITQSTEIHGANWKYSSTKHPYACGGIQAGTRGNTCLATVGEFIEQRYFPRLNQRLQMPAGNELHIEPSTVKGYRDIQKVHVNESPVAKIQLRNFTSRDGQRFLESLPQELSHQTHLRVKSFLRGVFTWAIASGALEGTNPMERRRRAGERKGPTTRT